jgi:hypothetical protein
MKKIQRNLMLVVVILVSLNACVPTTPEWEKQFGHSARNIVAMQTLNPNAGETPVAGAMDGQAAREAVGRYRNSFKDPQVNSNSFVIGVSR